VIVKIRSLKTKVTLIVTGCVVTLLVLVSVLEAYRVRTDLREVLGNQQHTLVSRVADEIDEKLKTTHGALIAVSKVIPPDIVNDPARLKRDLDNRAGLQSLFDSLFIFSPDGMTLVDLPATRLRGARVGDREFFREVLRDRKPHISQPFLGRTSKQPFVMLTAPILNKRGEVAAIFAGSLSLLRPNFLGKIGAASVGKTGSFALLGRDRTIIISGDEDHVMTPGPAPGDSPYFDRAVAGEEGWEESVNSRGLHALFSYSPLEMVPWVVVAVLPAEEAFAPIVAIQRHVAQMTILLLVLVAPLVWLGTRYLLAPLLRLHDAIRRIRSDPDTALDVPVRGQDEISDLASEFNALMREQTKAEAARRESEHRLRMITDNTPALISYVDSELRYRYANATYGEWFGVTPERMLGRTMREVLGESGYASREPHIHEALAGRKADFDLPPALAGSERHIHTRYVPDVRSDGSVAGFFILASDVTALKHSDRMLRESEQQLSLALEGSQLALFDWNIATGEVFLSDRWAVILGGKPAPTHTTFAALAELVHPEDTAQLDPLIRDALKGVTPYYRVEHRVRNNDGGWIWIQSHGQVTARDHRDGRAVRLIGTNADVTERKRAEAELAESRTQLERAAQHDGLTGLPNRNLLGDRLEQALARARRNQQLISLFYLDLDRFKEINDALGHAAGDALLKAFAERLNACVRETDTVARVGGDEFVILLEDVREDGDARAIAEKIIDAMRREFHVDAKTLRATTSIGIAFTRGGTSGEELMKQADAVLYEAKRAGRNGYRVARPALEVVEGKPPGRREKPGHGGKS